MHTWFESEEAENIRRSHIADNVADYTVFRDGLISLFGRFEFEGAYRAKLRSLRQSGSESVAAYVARTTDLCSRAYVNFSTEDQLSLAVHHIISGISDTSSRDYLQRERARRPLEWQEAVRIAQASEAARLSEHVHPIAAVMSLTTPNSNLGVATACTNAGNSGARNSGRESSVNENAHASRNKQSRADRN